MMNATRLYRKLLTVLAAGLAAGAGAVEVREYLVCNGSTYVDTGIKPDKTTRVAVDFATTDTAHDKMIFGERNGGYNFLCWLGYRSGSTETPCIGSSGNLTGTSSGCENGERLVLDMSANGVVTSGVTNYPAGKFASYVTDATSSLSLLLFGLQDIKSGTAFVDSRKYYGNCYACKIHHGGERARFYLPTVDSTGMACFIDTVANDYVYPAAGTFTASSAISSSYRIADEGVVQCAVTVSTSGAGSVSDGSGSGPAFWVDEGGTVTLTATPAAGSKFTNWSGDLSAITSGAATDPTITVTVDFAKRLTACFAESAWTVDDAFAYFHVDDRILTVDVPRGAISTYDYTSLLAGVTNVVKKGPGALQLSAASSYAGDWHVDEGEVQFGVEYSFGAHGTATASNGRIYVADGATLFSLPAPNASVFKCKDVYIAGIGTQYYGDKTASDNIRNPSRFGVMVGPTESSGTRYNQYARWHLTDDVTYYEPSRPWCFQYGLVDVAGHTFASQGNSGCNIHFASGEVITNSSDAAGCVKLNGSGLKYHLGGITIAGNSVNTLDARNNGYPLSIEGVVKSGWTLLLGGGGGIGGAMDQANPDGTSACYDGSVVFSGATKFYVHEKSGYTLNLKGAISGDSSASWTVTRGHSVNIHSTVNTFAGSIALDSANCGTYRARLKMMKGSVFSAKSLSLDGSDFVMDDDTRFAVCDTTVTKTNCTIRGGQAGTTIASVTQTGTGTLTLDTPATIPLLAVSSGAVTLTRAPDLTNLTCAAGASVNLGKNTLSIETFEGDPSLVTNGTLHVRSDCRVPLGCFIPASFDAVVCVTSAESLGEGDHQAFYSANDIALGNIRAALAAGDYATFSKQAIASGDHKGQTLVTMTVSKTAPAATWAATKTGGSWSSASNWKDSAAAPLAAAVTFPKALAASVPVTADLNATVYGLTVETGAGESDWKTSFGYAFAGTSVWYADSNPTYSFLAGQNTLDVPQRGSGTLSVETALYPLTNVTGAVYSKTTIGEKTLGTFTGTLDVNPSKQTWNGRTEIHPGAFAGKLAASAGEVKVDSLAFVKSRDDLTFNGTVTLAYAGGDATIPGLTWNSWLGDINVAEDTTLAVDDFYTKESSTALYKTGLGTLKLGGTGTAVFTRTNTGTGEREYGFAWTTNVFGRPSPRRHCSVNVCQGTLEVGTLGDSASAPTVSAAAMTLGNHNAFTDNARLVVNNGSLTVAGTLWLPYYTANENDTAVRGITVNGGSFHAEQTDARIGWVSSDGRPFGRQVFEVNGGSFTIDNAFNLTQLCPYEGSTGKATYQSTMTHAFTVNAGTVSFGNFKMGYAYGRSWDGTVTDNNGYGQGWQPDAYLTVNGGEVTVTDYLLTTDRADSRSWTVLNGGVLKVNMISNTVGTAASTYLTFNGGTLAPTGDGDNPDELTLKASFTSAVVSTNGAVVTTAYLPSGKGYVIEQDLTHDPLLADIDGGLTKRGAGTLTLAGTNTFTGPVTVEAGTLVLTGKPALSAMVEKLSLASGAKLRVNSGSVSARILSAGGASLGAGLYGSSESGASIIRDDLFEGKGVVQIGSTGFCIFMR